MIDLAVIAAIPDLHHLSAVGTIDMALAHLVLTEPAYAAYFRTRAEQGVTVYLDNSAYELQESTGAGLPAEPVLRAAQLTGAHVIVCQDVLFDGPATIAATRRFLDAARHLATTSATRPQFMAVPQGRTRDEWLRCYNQLAAMPGIDLIGLSKLSVPRCFDAPVAEARLACTAHLLARGTSKPLHLLGGDRSLPWELAEHRRLGHDQPGAGPGVRSNDSSFAYWYAVTGTSVDAATGRAEREAPAKPDLTAAPLDRAVLATALAHVALLRHAAGLSTAPLPADATADETEAPCH